ncbi:MAG: hypothetical protein AAGJ18_15985 [Bacteroidota bacterium]
MEEYKKSFKYWKTQEVEEVFGIRPAKNKGLMKVWECVDCAISKKEKESIISLQTDLIAKVKYWNEVTLKFYFLGPFLRLIRYDNEKYNSFFEQNLRITTEEGIAISGTADFLVATGKQIPRVLFSIIHSYKPEPEIRADPQGQLLMNMVAAQKMNAKRGLYYPLYGAYVVQQSWFFTILDGNEYIESLAYDATQKDIFKIFCMLRQAKYYIDQEVDKVLATN